MLMSKFKSFLAVLGLGFCGLVSSAEPQVVTPTAPEIHAVMVILIFNVDTLAIVNADIAGYPSMDKCTDNMKAAFTTFTPFLPDGTQLQVNCEGVKTKIEPSKTL